MHFARRSLHRSHEIAVRRLNASGTTRLRLLPAVVGVAFGAGGKGDVVFQE